MHRRTIAVPAALLLLSGLAACGSDDSEGGEETSGSAASGSISGLEITGDFGKEATVTVDGLDVSEAETDVVIEGDGAEVGDDTALKYRFAVAKGADGAEVLSNFTQPEPESLTVADQPPAIKDAIEGTTIGSRVVLAAPVSDVLGEQGAPQAGLAPEDDVVFVFDLIEEAAQPLAGPEGTEVDPPADAPAVVTDGDTVTGLDFSDAPAKASDELQVIPLVEGEGDPIKQGDNVTVNYYGAVYGEDKPFDSSFERGEPTAFPLTEGGLIDGWVQGLEGVTVGSRVMLIVPPELGYGDQDQGEDIPANSTLVFVIDVLGANL
jgi:peptidylprolyl isomerase